MTQSGTPKGQERPVNLPQLKQAGYTLDDWKTWEGAWELIAGVAYPTYGMAPAPAPEHQRVAVRFSSRCWLALDEAKQRSGGTCEIFPAPIDLFLGDTVVQPDLLVVCDPTKITERGIEGAPELVVEILSPSTASKDLTRKRWLYEGAGVPEYLIIDPQEQVGVLLRLEGGVYVEAAHLEWGAEVDLLGGKLRIPLGN